VSTSPTWFQSAFFGQKRGRGVKFTMESPGLPRKDDFYRAETLDVHPQYGKNPMEKHSDFIHPQSFDLPNTMEK
jgi:hypothetical protein